MTHGGELSEQVAATTSVPVLAASQQENVYIIMRCKGQI